MTCASVARSPAKVSTAKPTLCRPSRNSSVTKPLSGSPRSRSSSANRTATVVLPTPGRPSSRMRAGWVTGSGCRARRGLDAPASRSAESPRPWLCGHRGSVSGVARQELLLREAEEAFLVGPDLVQIHVVEAGVRVLLDLFEVLLGVQTANDLFGDVVLAHHRSGVLEVARQRELLGKITLDPGVRPPLVRGSLRVVLAVGEADRYLPKLRLSSAARGLELLDDLCVGRSADQSVAKAAGELGGVGLRGCNVDRRRLVGQRVHASLLDRVVATVVALVAALPEEMNHLDRLLEHLEPHLPFGPAVPEDVLVQVLARADAEEKASGQHGGRRRRSLGDDRRMNADRGARHAGSEAEALGGLRDTSDHRPDEGGVPLLVHPGMEVIGDERVGEPRLLRGRGVADEIERRVLLAGEGVAGRGHYFFFFFLAAASPPRLDAPGELAIFAARSFDMPFFFSPSYCFSFLTLGRLLGTDPPFLEGAFPAVACLKRDQATAMKSTPSRRPWPATAARISARATSPATAPSANASTCGPSARANDLPTGPAPQMITLSNPRSSVARRWATLQRTKASSEYRGAVRESLAGWSRQRSTTSSTLRKRSPRFQSRSTRS